MGRIVDIEGIASPSKTFYVSTAGGGAAGARTINYMVGTGDCRVTLVTGGTSISRVLHVERVSGGDGGGGFGFGDDEEMDRPLPGARKQARRGKQTAGKADQKTIETDNDRILQGMRLNDVSCRSIRSLSVSICFYPLTVRTAAEGTFVQRAPGSALRLELRSELRMPALRRHVRWRRAIVHRGVRLRTVLDQHLREVRGSA